MVFHIDTFVANCRQLAREPGSAEALVSLMRETVADPAAVAGAVAPLDGDEMTAGNLVLGRDHIVFEDESVTVFIVETEPGVLQPPHDHQMDAVIGVFEGEERNRFFNRDDAGQVAQYGETLMKPGDVLAIRPDMIHAISAPADRRCRALHVYLGALSSVKRSIFDPQDGAEYAMTEARYARFCQPDTTGTGSGAVQG